MDKKNLLIGVSLLFLAFGAYIWSAQQMAEYQEEQARRAPVEVPEAPEAEAVGETLSDIPERVSEPVEVPEVPSEVPEVEEDLSAIPERAPESTLPTPEMPGATTASDAAESIVLENDYIRVAFDPREAAIREVRFLQSGPDNEVDPYTFNEQAPRPALALSWEREGGIPRPFSPPFEVLRVSEGQVNFRYQTDNGLTIERVYVVPQPSTGIDGEPIYDRDPYNILHKTRLLNGRETAFSPARLYLNLGAAMPVGSGQRGDVMYLNAGYYDGARTKFFKLPRFTGSGGFMGIGARPPMEFLKQELPSFQWAAVKNQFFVGVLSPANDEEGPSYGDRLFAQPLTIQTPTGPLQGIQGAVGFDLPSIAPGENFVLSNDFYVGPKEYTRLSTLGENQAKLMQFGVFEPIAIILLKFMRLIHQFVPNWGLSIILMTLIIRTVLWPITAQAAKNQKRMAKIQEPMKELREKYKDNPQKMQRETLALFKQHRVNPAAGCLPLLMQIPIFLGLFWMLRTASELRFADFLWVQDLSQADTIATIGGFPINILPVTMAVTMYFQMRMMPMNPAADETQQMVQKMFRFMPAIMLIFLYNFAAGLTLYWTMSNCVTILQQYLTNKRQDTEPEPAPIAAKPAKRKPGQPAAQEPDYKKAERRAKTKGAHGGGGKKKRS
ncbi:MAG: YidC/Oxa1 family insertase periplasmic-domain containing protein [Verrucomicrobiota bacterium]